MTTKNQHTPGPWHAVTPPSCLLTTRHIQTEHGERIAEVGTPGGGGVGIIQDVANARLIAASPEMYEALKQCACDMEHNGWGTGFGQAGDEPHPALAQVWNAISKAEGRQ